MPVCALPHSRPLLVGLPPALTHPRAAGHRPRTTKSLTRCHSPQRRGPAPRRSAAPSTHLSAHASRFTRGVNVMVPSHTHRPRLALHTRVSPSPCPFPGLMDICFCAGTWPRRLAGWRQTRARATLDPTASATRNHAISCDLLFDRLRVMPAVSPAAAVK